MGIPLDTLTMDETLELIESSIREKSNLRHVVINVAKLVKARVDPELRDAVIESDIISADGMGIIFGARLLGKSVPERVTGIDLFQALIPVCERANYRLYFLGATESVLHEALGNLKRRYPKLQIAGAHDGYFGAEAAASVVRDINSSRADCLFVAMSSPEKERFLRRHDRDLQVPFKMGIGGTLDVLAGRIRRAPRWMQRSGLEWFWRTLQEPGRLGPRYLRSNTIYAALLLREVARCLLVQASAHRATASEEPGQPSMPVLRGVPRE